MIVAPTPVLPLRSGVLPVIPTIGSALYHKVTPVGVIFAVVPIVVVTAVPIVDPHLHAGFLGFWAGPSYCWCGKSCAQSKKLKYRLILRKVYSSRSETSRFRFPVVLTMHFLLLPRCSIQHAIENRKTFRPRSARGEERVER